MLRVIIELVPHGDESKKYVIDEIKIINDLSHKDRPEYGNYVVKSDDVEFPLKEHNRGDGLAKLVLRSVCGWYLKNKTKRTFRPDPRLIEMFENLRENNIDEEEIVRY